MDFFNDLEEIRNVKITSFNPVRGTTFEPEDGTVYYNGKLYYFKLRCEFDSGNTYVMYLNNFPVYYFSLYPDPESYEEDSPWLNKEEWSKLDES